MVSLMLVTAVVASVLNAATIAGADLPAGVARAASDGSPVPVAARQLGVIPANCTMDPFKKVYSCCTTDSAGKITCTEHPLDTKWPVMRLPKVQMQMQPTAPATEPGAAPQ